MGGESVCIPEFVCGVMVTLALEGTGLIALGVRLALSEKKRGGNKKL